jgi:hypothetical protein
MSASPVEARKNPCSLKRCKPAVKARCAGFKKKAKRDCRKGIVAMCKSGTCSCTDGTPLCADPPTTTVPTTTVVTTSSTTSSSTSTTTLMSGTCLRDIGDGTIYDVCSHLQWEKKTSGAGLQNVDTFYAWAGCCDGDCSNVANLCQPNAAAAATCAAHSDGGTQGCDLCSGASTCTIVDVDELGITMTVWEWLNQLNATSFAGHNDWRLPLQTGSNTLGEATELESILDPMAPGCDLDKPCIDPIFGPTSANAYCSATTVTSSTKMVWVGNFGVGNVATLSKQFGFYARAVRNND